MSRIIGREKEEKILESAYNSDKPEMIALYGRRRVGKTYLVKSFFSYEKDNAHLFFITGTKDGTLEEQIKNFSDQFLTFSSPGAIQEVQTNWRDAFKVLTHNIKLCEKRKIVLFFDEFPWMVTRGSRLLSMLEYFWNQYWSNDPRIKLIICGSSAGWILKNIVNNRGGLYNRVTQTIHLKPFTLAQTKDFLSYSKVYLNKRDITDLYMVLGGIPFYLSKLEPGLSAAQNIEKLAFSDTSFLLHEFENLYKTLFDSGDNHIALARIIAKSPNGIGQEELARKAENLKSGGTIVSWLSDLEKAGFIMRITPFGHKKRGIFYKMIDEYSLFYFHWIEPIKQTLLNLAMKEGYWQNEQTTQAWYSWAGYAFETICLKHHILISKALNLAPSAVPYSWRYVPKKGSEEHGSQIDLLFDRKDNAITVCEVKYTLTPYVLDKEVAQRLGKKIQVFKEQTRTRKNVFIALVSAQGAKKTLWYDEVIGTDGLVTLEDFFQESDSR